MQLMTPRNCKELGGPGCVTLPKDQDRLKKCKTLPPPKQTTRMHIPLPLPCFMILLFRATNASQGLSCSHICYVNGVGNAFSFIHSTHLFLKLLQPPLTYTSSIL